MIWAPGETTRTTLEILRWGSKRERSRQVRVVGRAHPVPEALARELVAVVGVVHGDRVLIAGVDAVLERAIADRGAKVQVLPNWDGVIPTGFDLVIGAPSRQGFARVVHHALDALRPDGKLVFLSAIDVLVSPNNASLWGDKPPNRVSVLSGFEMGRKDKRWGCYAAFDWSNAGQPEPITLTIGWPR